MLGLPIENDWILYAPYSDKSLIRNVITFEFERRMGNYASKTVFCELFVNGDYRGIYVLMENIKRDNDRVDIAKITPNDVTGDDITGGYILKVDWDDEDNPDQGWTSEPAPRPIGEKLIYFQFHDPGPDELLNVQKQYMIDFIYEFESTLNQTNFDSVSAYRKYINIISFVEHIFSEITKNVDAYHYSTYMYKDKDSKDGRLTMGPIWDYNLGYGNVDYWENAQFAPGWMFTDDFRMYWFRRLISDPYFSSQYMCRWEKLRTDLFSNQNVINLIDSIVIPINEAQQRNFDRWPILGQYVWPNQFVGNTYAEEIDFLKNWIIDRLEWMDVNSNWTCITLITALNVDTRNEIIIYPNPSIGIFNILIQGSANYKSIIKVYNSVGKEIFNDQFNGSTYRWYATQNGSGIPNGIYIINIINEKGESYSKRVIKQ